MGASPQDLQTFFCECGTESCSQTVELTLTDYEAAHAQRDRFVVAPGHDDERLERVVERNRLYLVVEKFGEAERIAENEERS